MRGGSKSFLVHALKEENGQMLPWLALVSVLFLGISGLTLDLGQGYVAYRELQASTDAAALAGGYALSLSTATTASVKTAVTAYSSVSPGVNVSSNLPSTTITATPVCSSYVTGLGIPCSASPTGDNAVVVRQTSVIPTTFIHVLSVFGIQSASSLTISTISTAAMRGSTNAQYNVAIVLDSTGSMSSNDTDGNCSKNTTKEVCALSGIQTLLSGLTPCSPGSTSSTCKSAFDSVALFTFPNVQANTAAFATKCAGGSPQGAPYSVPAIGAIWSTPNGNNPNYEITSGFLNDYSSTNAAGGSMATTSPIGIATGADPGKNCNGLTTPISGEGTYLAGAIYAAQSSLVAAQAANPSSQNALVILTDGDANASNTFTDATGKTLSTKSKPPTLNTNGVYPSMIDQCQQGITAAQYASSNGTTVYVVAYQAGTSGCSTDAAAYRNPCANLQAMATAPADFYSDATSANKGACTSPANPSLTLNQVFQAVSTSFTVARLLPVGK